MLFQLSSKTIRNCRPKSFQSVVSCLCFRFCLSCKLGLFSEDMPCHFHSLLYVPERRRAADHLPGPALLPRSHQADQPAQAIPREGRPHQAHGDRAQQRQVNPHCRPSLQAATCGSATLTPPTETKRARAEQKPQKKNGREKRWEVWFGRIPGTGFGVCKPIY